MTSNQRRPGFRLPWASETEAAEAEAAATEAAAAAEAGNDRAPGDAAGAATAPLETETTSDQVSPEPQTQAAPSAAGTPNVRSAPTAPLGPRPAESSTGFMRDLVAAMRRVAEETRQAGLSDLRTKAEEQVRTLEADAERRREELKAKAETDVAQVGDWAKAETERIGREAEQRVVARRAQLDQQLAAETTLAESEAKELRDRVEGYERELDAYHAQLSDIADPAAFAAAAKRMPAPPSLGGGSQPSQGTSAPATTPSATPAQPPASSDNPAATDNPGATDNPAETGTPAANPAAKDDPSANDDPAGRHDPSTNHNPGPNPGAATRNDASGTPQVHPAEEEVLAARLAELDATLSPTGDPAGANATPTATAMGAGDPTSTEILVKGLGSFGAITGFRQALAGVDGVEGVSLSLGPTGEFVFRAIHPAGFDVAAAISKLEGESATVDTQPDGGLRVTLDRAR